MTPRELRDEMASVARRWDDAQTRDLARAWHTAVFYAQAWVGKLPPLSAVLAKSAPLVQRATPAAQRAQVALLSEHLGVAMRPISEEAKRALLRLRES